MNADFQPLLVGSLPYTDVKTGIDAVFAACPSSPAWPQFPRLGSHEGMEIQYLEGIPGWSEAGGAVTFRPGTQMLDEISDALGRAMQGDASSFAISPGFSLGFPAFMERLAVSAPAIVKGQVIGPVTLLLSHKTPDGQFLMQDQAYRELVPRALAMKARFQLERFRAASPGSEYVIFLDEPILSQIGSAVLSLNKDDVAALLVGTAELIEGAHLGIHICGNSDWDFILRQPLGIVNFDAYTYGDNFLIYGDAIRTFIGRGGKIACGIVPTEGHLVDAATEGDVIAKALAFCDSIAGLVGTTSVRRSLFVTPSCGMGTLTEAQTAKVFALLGAVSAHLRKNYGATPVGG